MLINNFHLAIRSTLLYRGEMRQKTLRAKKQEILQQKIMLAATKNLPDDFALTPAAVTKQARPQMSVAMLDDICLTIAEHCEPLSVACRRTELPTYAAVNKWLLENEEYKSRIDEAMKAGSHLVATKLRQIARGGIGSTGCPARDKLVIDTEMRLLAKLSPKEYGDKQTIDTTATITVESKLSVGEAARRLAFALTQSTITDAEFQELSSE